MFTTAELTLIKQLIDSTLKKVKDKPEVYDQLTEIVTKINDLNELTLPISVTKEDILKVNEIVSSIEANIKKYVSLTGGANLQILETIKREITGEMVYLSTFRDKFIYELEFLEDVFKKEMFSKLVKTISTTEGVSITQAEKVVNTDEAYMKMRRDLQDLRQMIGGLKTKYTFFEKSLQLIIQSVSVAGKELHNSKMDN